MRDIDLTPLIYEGIDFTDGQWTLNKVIETCQDNFVEFYQPLVEAVLLAFEYAPKNDKCLIYFEDGDCYDHGRDEIA